jgi:hypothetical protein
LDKVSVGAELTGWFEAPLHMSREMGEDAAMVIKLTKMVLLSIG